MTSKYSREEALELFRTTCCMEKDVDPWGELCWLSLSIGFFLALGFDPETANDLGIDARYKHQYWFSDNGD